MQTLPSFDELKAMAEQAPEKLEALRLSMSEEIINNASIEMQPRLRAQMSHINQVIAKGKNPQPHQYSIDGRTADTTETLCPGVKRPRNADRASSQDHAFLSPKQG